MAFQILQTPKFPEEKNRQESVEDPAEGPKEAMEFSSDERVMTKSTGSSDSVDTLRPSILKKSKITTQRKQEIAGQKRVSIDESQNLVIFIEPLPKTSILDSICTCKIF